MTYYPNGTVKRFYTSVAVRFKLRQYGIDQGAKIAKRIEAPMLISAHAVM